MGEVEKTVRKPRLSLNVAPPIHERFYATLERDKERTGHSGTEVAAQTFIVDLLNLYDQTYPGDK